MAPALLHRPSSYVRQPSQMVRDLAAARRRRESDDLRQRAAWVAQARHTPTLEDWIDEDLVTGPVRAARAWWR